MKASMRDFIEQGQIHGFEIGSSEENLHQRLGTPDSSGSTTRKRKYPTIETYGDFEFHIFDGGVVSLIYSDSFKELSLGDRRKFDRWFFTSGRSIEDVSSILEENKIKFHQEACQTNKNIDYLYLKSGVKLMFCREVEEFMHPDYTGLFGFSLNLENQNKPNANKSLQATGTSPAA